jgi:hypothetical protein
MNHAFPRVYRTGRSGLVFYVGLGGIALVLSIAGGAAFLLLADKTPGSNWLVCSLCAGFALLGAYILATGLRLRVVLEADAIELHGVFLTKRGLREEFSGRRLFPMQYGPPVIKLYPRYSHGSVLTLPQYLKTDAEFDAWFAAIPDIDAEEAKASLDSVLEDSGLEGSKDERLAALTKARRIAQWLRWVALAVTGWLWFYPHPYDLAVACGVVAPWLAVIVAARGGPLYKLNPRPNDAGADLSVSVMTPGFALAIRALFDTHIFDWQNMLLATIVATAVCMLIMWWAVGELRASTGTTAVIALLMVPYVYGTVTLANMEFDASEPVPYAAKVLGSHIGSGKTREYYLKLGPWGPRAESEDVDVGSEYYGRGSHRETVCVYLFRGAFGIRWFEVWDCPRNDSGA